MAREEHELQLRPEEIGGELPNIPWGTLQPAQAHFVYGLVDFLHDSERYALFDGKTRVDAARNKLPVIAELADHVNDWDVFGTGGVERFKLGLQTRIDSMSDTAGPNSIWEDGLDTMLCEERFFTLFDDMLHTNAFSESWRNVHEKGKDAYQEWIRENLAEGKEHIDPATVPPSLQAAFAEPLYDQTKFDFPWPPIQSRHRENSPFWPLEQQEIPLVGIKILDIPQLFSIVSKQAADGRFEDSALGLLRPQNVNDEVLQMIFISIMGLRGSTEYTSHTALSLSEARMAQNDHGYYDYTKVRDIRRKLADMGLESEFVQDKLNSNSLKIPVEDIEVHAHFGIDSREAEEARIMWQIARVRQEGRGLGSFEYEIAEMQKGLTHKAINVNLYTEGATTISDRLHIPLSTERSFERQLGLYTQVLEKLVTALYHVENVSPPKEQMVFRL